MFAYGMIEWMVLVLVWCAKVEVTTFVIKVLHILLKCVYIQNIKYSEEKLEMFNLLAFLLTKLIFKEFM